MEHRPLDEIRSEATVIDFKGQAPESPRALRRARLERFASVLEQHEGPIRLFSRIEYMSENERRMLRVDHSPFEIAYRDPVLRAQGLASDRLKDGIEFFSLSPREAHDFLCDCHYTGSVTSDMMAARARSLASRMSFGELCAKIGSGLRHWFGRA